MSFLTKATLLDSLMARSITF